MPIRYSFYFVLFTYGCAGPLLLPAGFSLIEASGGCSLAAVRELLDAGASLVVERGL